MPIIYVDNKSYEVKADQNLLEACLSLGFDIPYFCWHPAMHSVGACRLCAVKQFKDKNDTKGKIVMSCMTAVKDEIRISINDPDAVRFRKSVIEWLMVNHPHDCPVCDEGGECHLQDMTLMTGHVYRRYRHKKRTHRNQNLGPFIRHEMNRCIQCYRCVRFYTDYAGGRDFGVFDWHDNVYFGRHEDGVLVSEFSGNLIEVCPTGVFTDKTFAKHYTRKWDLQTAPSVCVHCGLGCNIIPAERYGTLRRIQNRFNGEVNGYFICDRGRFGYEFVNSTRRIRKPLRRRTENKFEPLSREAMLSELAVILKNSKRIIGIGSTRTSLESNFALRQFVGAENFFLGISKTESQLVSKVISILKNGQVRAASLHDLSMADAAFVLGENIPDTAPMAGLALRQSILRKPAAIAKKLQIEEWNDAAFREAIQDKKGPLFIATVGSTRLDDAATSVFRAAPDDLARLGFAVAHELNQSSSSPMDLNDETRILAKKIADELRDAERPIIVSGTSCGCKSIIEASANVAYALHSIGKVPQLFFAVSACNTMGLGLINGKPIDETIEALINKSADTLIILENDIYRYIDAETADKLLDTTKNIIALDSLENSTTAKAHFVLPAATYPEGSGTFVNNECRAQRIFKVFAAEGDIQESWRWLEEMGLSSKEQPEIYQPQNLDGLINNLIQAIPSLKAISEIAPPANFRITGQKIPRQSNRFSGQTAIHANINVNEPKIPEDYDSPLSFSMEGYGGQPPSSLIPRFWRPEWNSVQSVNKFQSEVGGALRGGAPGKRLIEPSESNSFKYFTEIPDSFKPRKDELLIIPAYHVFGSEELSSAAGAISELSEKPYIAVNPQDTGKLFTNEKGLAEIALSNTSYFLPIKVVPQLPVGLAMIPMGLCGLRWDGEPFWLKSLRP